MSPRNILFGVAVKEQSHPHGAVGAAFNHGGRTKKPPIAVARTVARLAEGPTTLTADELANLSVIDLAVVDVTESVMKAKAEDMLARGAPPTVINAEITGTQKHYSPAEPIGPLTYFAPA